MAGWLWLGGMADGAGGSGGGCMTAALAGRACHKSKRMKAAHLMDMTIIPLYLGNATTLQSQCATLRKKAGRRRYSTANR